MQVQYLTRQLAEFNLGLRFADLPAEAITAAKVGILDILGVAIAGADDPATRMFMDASVEEHERGDATLLGTALTASGAKAALINGFAAHVLDYDDIHITSDIHVSTTVLPAALAAAEIRHRSGRELLTAYVAGFEIGCRLGKASKFGRQLLMNRGVHPTVYLGHLGSAAATGKLMGLDTQQMARSFGIVASLATAGLVKSLGNMCNALGTATAAHNAVLAAQLAGRGFTGPDDVFDGKHNALAVHGCEIDPGEVVRDLGRQFEVTGNTIKLYACTGWRNPILEAVIALAVEHDLKPDQVKHVCVSVWHELMQVPNYPEPRTGIEGKFSVQHVVAVGLIDRCGGIRQFTDERVSDPALARLRNRVSLAGDAALSTRQIRVAIRTVDGQEYVRSISAQKGGPANPASWSELVQKFSANASTVLNEQCVRSIADRVQALEDVDDVGALTRLCRRVD